MKMYHYWMIAAVAGLFYAQSASAQTVHERFPLKNSACSGGVMVSAYFDQNTSSGIQDYNCGSNTYNGHKGTDFAPYGSTRATCVVVAAAPGKVLTTKDGVYDQRSGSTADNPDCSNSNSYGNYVEIQQNDGSIVIYAHMKKGSIKVSKGQTVTCGQEIGVAQSSGCSTGIHLHFDIKPQAGGTRFDPYKGSCGSSSSRWVSQGAYKALPGDTCECIPNCSGKTCGDNGCGGSCGSCKSNETCQSNKCVCVPNCSGKTCGSDGCGGTCGSCKSNETCQSNKCVCVPNCNGKTCGSDGCGGTCGSCKSNETCQANQCVCVPNCNGKTCGDDGCGGSCGSCQANEACQANQCVCIPNCNGKSCGDDGCGGACGFCTMNETCQDNQCVCLPNCNGKTCGDDGCGGSCGSCQTNETCQDNQCVCVPNCEGKSCGDDGCGGSCGSCSDGQTCADNQCVCAPNCDGKSCGDDGCGGLCGECKDNEKCTDNQCVCVPNCDGKSCEEDGCGGFCPGCQECDDSEKPVCDGKRVKSCQNGKYVYKDCSDGLVCNAGACVNIDENPSAFPHVTLQSDSCSATPASSSKHPISLALFAVLGLFGLGRLRKRNNRAN